jgi:hypothetical protein
MANSDIIDLIIQTTANMLTYMLPVIAICSGLTLILSFLYSVTLGSVKRIF